MHNIVLFPHSMVSATCKQANMLWTVALCDCVMTLWNLLSILVSSWEKWKELPVTHVCRCGRRLALFVTASDPVVQGKHYWFSLLRFVTVNNGLFGHASAGTPAELPCSYLSAHMFSYLNLKTHLLIQSDPVRLGDLLHIFNVFAGLCHYISFMIHFYIIYICIIF